MTRSECEKSILDKLSEIRETAMQYCDPDHVMLLIYKDWVYTYALDRDEEGNPIAGHYILCADRHFEEAENEG